ncbi:MAG: PAS domain S-box protein [Rhodocyclaceae bacterium]|nr:PAS domain S-box protein [Rhodocyclaceae bacterium]
MSTVASISDPAVALPPHEAARVRAYYGQMPTDLATVLVGVLCTAVFLFEQIGTDLLKAWAGYMLSIISLRAWIWYSFHTTEVPDASVGRWETLAALGTFLTGLGWAALVGPLFPANSHPAQELVHLLLITANIAAVIFSGISRRACFAFLLPVLPLTLFHFVFFHHQGSIPAMVGAVALVAVIFAAQHLVHRVMLENLRRQDETAGLLNEQKAIFESATLGIAVIHNRRIIKCNRRLGELLGYGAEALTTLPLEQHLVDKNDLEKLVTESHAAFAEGKSYQTILRLRRANASEFWAEFSGHALALEGQPHKSVWLVGDVTLRARRG